jgi:hypothetical protein
MTARLSLPAAGKAFASDQREAAHSIEAGTTATF